MTTDTKAEINEINDGLTKIFNGKIQTVLSLLDNPSASDIAGHRKHVASALMVADHLPTYRTDDGFSKLYNRAIAVATGTGDYPKDPVVLTAVETADRLKKPFPPNA